MRALLFALLTLAPHLGADALPAGQVIPRVTCQARPTYSYALYLPKAYRDDRAWPVLYGFSPVGGGEDPVRLFQNAAERFGWIVVGSNDSRNGPLRPAQEAAEAMWKDVHARFRIDPRRSYGVGFSGGARMALRLALSHPKEFAGLISIGAFGTGEGLLTGLGHLQFYLVCGQEDFNHWELVEGRRELQSRGWTALANRFEGGHVWLPESRTEPILTWFELGAARKGWRPVDPTLESEFQAGLEADAAKTEPSLLALRRWQEIVEANTGTPRRQKALEQAQTLERHPAVLEELRLERQYAAASRELAELRSDTTYATQLNLHVARLPIAPPIEKRMLRRLLEGPYIAFRIALGEAVEKKQWDRVLQLGSNMAALDEREGGPCIYVAAALVQLGRPREALPHLRAAQTRGYRKPERIRALPELKPLAGDPEFEAILKAMAP